MEISTGNLIDFLITSVAETGIIFHAVAVASEIASA